MKRLGSLDYSQIVVTYRSRFLRRLRSFLTRPLRKVRNEFGTKSGVSRTGFRIVTGPLPPRPVTGHARDVFSQPRVRARQPRHCGGPARTVTAACIWRARAHCTARARKSAIHQRARGPIYSFIGPIRRHVATLFALFVIIKISSSTWPADNSTSYRQLNQFTFPLQNVNFFLTLYYTHYPFQFNFLM